MPRALYSVTDVYGRLGRSDDALNAIRQSVKVSRENEFERFLADALVNYGFRASDANLFDEARAAHEEAIEIETRLHAADESSEGAVLAARYALSYTLIYCPRLLRPRSISCTRSPTTSTAWRVP